MASYRFLLVICLVSLVQEALTAPTPSSSNSTATEVLTYTKPTTNLLSSLGSAAIAEENVTSTDASVNNEQLNSVRKAAEHSTMAGSTTNGQSKTEGDLRNITKQKSSSNITNTAVVREDGASSKLFSKYMDAGLALAKKGIAFFETKVMAYLSNIAGDMAKQITTQSEYNTSDIKGLLDDVDPAPVKKFFKEVKPLVQKFIDDLEGQAKKYLKISVEKAETPKDMLKDSDVPIVGESK